MAKSEMEQQIENIHKITKGFCLIINIINFEGNEDAKREDSEENIKLSLVHIGTLKLR